MTKNSDGTYDFRLENDSSMIVSGPSKCGKTSFVINLLKHREKMFRKPTRNIYWFYGVESPENHHALREMGVHLVEGVPDHDHFNQIDTGDIVILDDLQQESEGVKEITNLFIKGCHHKKFFVIKITQYLFGNRDQCVQNANAHYYVIFNNPRNQQQIIRYLARMFGPGNNSVIARMLNDVQQDKYGYLFVDFTADCDPHLRFRTSIVKDPVVFKLKKLNSRGAMDYSRVAITQPNTQIGGRSEQEVEREVQRMMNPQSGHLEGVARQLVTAPLLRTAAEARQRSRDLQWFQNFRQRLFGLAPTNLNESLLKTPSKSMASTLFETPSKSSMRTLFETPRKSSVRSHLTTPRKTSTPKSYVSTPVSYASTPKTRKRRRTLEHVFSEDRFKHVGQRRKKLSK